MKSLLFRLGKSLACLMAIALLIYGGWYWQFASPSLSFADEVESVEIVWGQENGKKTITVNDRPKIREFLAVLGRGKSTSDHKCGDYGRMDFQLKAGGHHRIGILPGHDTRYYEFRVYSDNAMGHRYEIYRVDRVRFTHAMAALGIEDLPEVCR